MSVMQYGGIIEQVASTATAGGTTNLTNTSAQIQVWTGTLNQTIVLPNATTFTTAGAKFEFYNTSTGTLTIETNGSAFLATVSPNSSLVLKLANNSSSAGTWVEQTGGTGTGTGSKNYLSAYTASTSGGTANTGNGNFENGSTSGWGLGAVGSPITNGLPVGTPTFTTATTLYTFQISVASPGAGSVYTNNGQTFTVLYTEVANTAVVMTGTGAPSASGTLTFVSGSPSGNLTFSSFATETLSTVSGGTQIAGSYSGSLAMSSNSTLGNCLASNAFFIDAEDQGKVLTVKFYYQIASGASNANFSGTSSNSFAWAIYDVTNSAWLGTAGQFGITQSSGSGYVTGTFQTAITTTELRFVLYNSAFTSGAVTMYLDDIFVGPQTAPIGPAVTDWVSYTPTGTWTSNATYTGKYRRVGDTGFYDVTVTLSGAPNAANLGINMPAGQVFDTTKMTNSVGGAIPELGIWGSTHASLFQAGVVYWAGTTQVAVAYIENVLGQIATVSNTLPFTWASGDIINVRWSGPVAGWSSNVNMSSDTDTRVVAMQYSDTSGASIGTSPAVYKFSTQLYDSHAAYSTSTGTYTVPVTGQYRVSASLLSAAVLLTTAESFQIYIYHNGAQYTSFANLGNGVSNNYDTTISGTISCLAGDTIQVFARSAVATTAATNAGFNLLSIERLSGPAVVAATESVNARYTFIGATGLPTATGETLTSTYATYTKVKDTHNAFNTSTGVYTIPVSGSYQVSLRASMSPSSANTGGLAIAATQAGSATTSSEAVMPFSGTGTQSSPAVTDIFNCLAGDTLTLTAIQNSGGTEAFLSTAAFNSFSISRVGN
jgi:hypothetical protein